MGTGGVGNGCTAAPSPGIPGPCTCHALARDGHSRKLRKVIGNPRAMESRRGFPADVGARSEVNFWSVPVASREADRETRRVLDM